MKHFKKVLSERKNQYIKTTLNKEEFDSIIMEILRKTVKLTINEIDKQNSNNNHLIFYETYHKLIAKNETPTLDEFINKVEQKRDGKSESSTQDITITNACEEFF